MSEYPPAELKRPEGPETEVSNQSRSESLRNVPSRDGQTRNRELVRSRDNDDPGDLDHPSSTSGGRAFEELATYTTQPGTGFSRPSENFEANSSTSVVLQNPNETEERPDIQSIGLNNLQNNAPQLHTSLADWQDCLRGPEFLANFQERFSRAEYIAYLGLQWDDIIENFRQNDGAGIDSATVPCDANPDIAEIRDFFADLAVNGEKFPNFVGRWAANVILRGYVSERVYEQSLDRTEYPDTRYEDLDETGQEHYDSLRDIAVAAINEGNIPREEPPTIGWGNFVYHLPWQLEMELRGIPSSEQSRWRYANRETYPPFPRHMEDIPLGVLAESGFPAITDLMLDDSDTTSEGEDIYNEGDKLDLSIFECSESKWEQKRDSKTEEKKICSICLDPLQTESRVVTFECSHVFHSDCARRWLLKRRTCPTCRHLVDAKDKS